MACSGSNTEVLLTRHDTPEKVAAQWCMLRALVVRPASALVYHLENHYCLIFATREWTAGGGYNGLRQVPYPSVCVREREREREREYLVAHVTREVETPLPSNSPHDHMILRVDLVGSHGRWKRPCLQTAHMTR
jgi:hypothetical protein